MKKTMLVVLVGLLLSTIVAVASDDIPDLHMAAMIGDAPTVKAIIGRGVDPNQRDSHGETPLMNAPTLEVVSLLLESGADVNARNPEGTTALMKASFQGAWMIVDELLKKGADVNASGGPSRMTALIGASLSGRDGRVYEYHSGRVQEGFSSLGSTHIVQALVRHGANVNARSKWGSTALMEASANGHINIVKFLLSQGAKKNLKDDHGKTALIYARERKQQAVIQVLISAGAK
jgi:ankyrin repeat protein